MPKPSAPARCSPRFPGSEQHGIGSHANAPARAYDRARDLPLLLPLWPWELEALSKAGHARLLAKLRRALRSERQRGLAGHWTYNLARHAQLLRAYRAEIATHLQARSADPGQAKGSAP